MGSIDATAARGQLACVVLLQILRVVAARAAQRWGSRPQVLGAEYRLSQRPLP